MDAKIISGIIGFISGAAVGGVTAWLITKKYDENKYFDLLDEQEEEWNNLYRRKAEVKVNVSVDDDEQEESADRPKPDVVIFDEKIDNNKGVKKYHHNEPNAYMEVTNKVTEGEKALVREDELKAAGKSSENSDIFEITEDQYMIDKQEYEKVTLDYYIDDDTLVTTDPEDLAENYYRCGREDLIGKVWRWAPDYIKEGNSDGAVYVRNNVMNIDFEVIVHEGSYKELMGEQDL